MMPQPVPSRDLDRFLPFLRQHGLGEADLTALPADASARRYFRLAGEDLLLMSDPSDPVGFASYLQVAAHLASLGLSAPHVHAYDRAKGLALIEDWGRGTYTQRLNDGADEEQLYARAIDALRALHDHPNATAIIRPALDQATLLDELRQTFCEWFAPEIRPDLDVAAFTSGFLALWAQALEALPLELPDLVLRDFHIDNMMELSGRIGPARVGLLDFQDAAQGFGEYDLVSLLQDARRDLAPGLEAKMLARYLQNVAPNDQADIMARYHLLGAQRHCRILGVFTRLDRRDNKTHYLKWMGRVARQFDQALDDAALHKIRDFLEINLPNWREIAPRIAPSEARSGS